MPHSVLSALAVGPPFRQEAGVCHMGGDWSVLVLALAVTMPLLVLWTDAMAILGGMLAAQVQLGVSAQWFLQSLPEAISLTNYWIGILKAVTFGILIALIAGYFGLRIQPDTESLGRGTTTSVVTSITGVILLDALYAIIFSSAGV